MTRLVRASGKAILGKGVVLDAAETASALATGPIASDVACPEVASPAVVSNDPLGAARSSSCSATEGDALRPDGASSAHARAWRRARANPWQSGDRLQPMSAGGIAGYTSGAVACGGLGCGVRSGLYALFGGMAQSALVIGGVGTDGTLPGADSMERYALRDDQAVMATTWKLRDLSDPRFLAIALTGTGYSHVAHADDRYWPTGSFYKLLDVEVPYPGEAYNNIADYGLLDNNCTTRVGLGFISPASYYSSRYYSGVGAYWMGP